MRHSVEPPAPVLQVRRYDAHPGHGSSAHGREKRGSSKAVREQIEESVSCSSDRRVRGLVSCEVRVSDGLTQIPLRFIHFPGVTRILDGCGTHVHGERPFRNGGSPKERTKNLLDLEFVENLVCGVGDQEALSGGEKGQAPGVLRYVGDIEEGLQGGAFEAPGLGDFVFEDFLASRI